jgi:ribosomal protein S18 acetylase RimI-like enzyme
LCAVADLQQRLSRGREEMAMMSLSSRPYAGTTDLEPLIDLLLLCRTSADLDPWPPIREIRWRLCSTTPAILADTRIWEDSTGAVQAFASLWDGEILLCCVHPRAQSDDQLEQMLAWAQARAQQHGARYGELAMLCVPLRDTNARDGDLLERRGFTLEAWSTLRMARSLHTPIQAPAIPEGFTIRHLAGTCELAAIVELHQAAFSTTSAGDERLVLMQDSAYLPDLDLVAIAPDGTFAAFCICSIGAEEARRQSDQQGWVELIGTHPRFRRRGLGQALLLTGLQRLRLHGVDTALLGTTSWNTPAQQLYEMSGFRTIDQLRWYTWESDAQDRWRTV